VALSFGSVISFIYLCIVNLKERIMNAKVEQILRKQAYDFAIQIGKSETEAQAEADNKIRSVNKLTEVEKKQKWVDITTGKKHTPKIPY
jgi:hypothetical protein